MSLLASVQFPAIGSLCAFAVVFALRIVIPKRMPLPAEIIALGSAGLVCYLTMMYILARSEVMRVIDFVRKT